MSDSDGNNWEITAQTRIRLDEVKARYAARLPTKASAILDRAQRLEREPALGFELEEAAHKLVGTAGSMGFHDVSDTARTLEKIAEGLRAEPPAADASISELIAVAEELMVLAKWHASGLDSDE